MSTRPEKDSPDELIWLRGYEQALNDCGNNYDKLHKEKEAMAIHLADVTNEWQMADIESIQLETAYDRLRTAAIALRQAQKAYMANRGNVELGKQVAVKARELDAALGEY